MNRPLPLEGIKVVELATVVAAPTTARLLADYGADVIKIEIPGPGDSMRVLGDMHRMPISEDNNPMFDLFNTGKKLVSINLKSGEGKEVFFKLLSQADVFITNTRKQSLERMGIWYQQIKDLFPKLIYAHFSGFGLTGKDKDRPGYDSTAFWLKSGVAGDVTLAGSFPARPPYAFGDIASASYFLNGILIAIFGRGKTGRGTLISTSLYGAGIWMSASFVVNTQEKYGNKLPAERYEPWSPFCDYYKCSDGKYIMFITKRYPAERQLMAEIFGLPELVTDPDLATIGSMRRSGKLPGIVRKLEEILLSKSSSEWVSIFEAKDVPYELSRHIMDVYTDAQAWDNGYVESMQYPDGVTVFPTPPIKYTEYGRRPMGKTAKLGADTDSVLKELGYSAGEILTLRQSEVIM